MAKYQTAPATFDIFILSEAITGILIATWAIYGLHFRGSKDHAHLDALSRTKAIVPRG